MPIVAQVPSDGQLAVTSVNEGTPFVLRIEKGAKKAQHPTANQHSKATASAHGRPPLSSASGTVSTTLWSPTTPTI